MTNIHPTAIIEKGAELGAEVSIGPYSVVGPHVVLGDRVRLESHVVISGNTSIGEESHLFPFASIGHRPQDLKYQGEESRLLIGKRNQIREYVTMQAGTSGDKMVTTIGNDGLFMACSHVAHDCQIGNHVILSNNCLLAGHCSVGDHVIFAGASGAHQFVRVGDHAFVGGMTGLGNDVIPFGLVIGNRGWLAGLNIVGMKRHNFNREQIHVLRKAYQLLFDDKEEGTLRERLDNVAETFAGDPFVQKIVDFIRAGSDRALILPKNDRGAS